MKQAAISITLLCTLFLTACTGQGQSPTAQEIALALRTDYIAMTACTASLTLTADYGQRVYDYGMDISYSPTEGTQITLTAPDLVAGVTAHVNQGSTRLEYDGASLETGPLDDSGLTPMGAIPLLLETLQSGYLAELSLEDNGATQVLRLCSRDADQTAGSGREVVLWLDVETGHLLAGEIFSQGQLVIDCQFTAFEMEL